MNRDRKISIKETVIFFFAIFCIIFNVSFALIDNGGYNYTYHIYDKGYILLSFFVILQTVAIGFTKKTSSTIILIVSFFMNVPKNICVLSILILLIIKKVKCKRIDALVKFPAIVYIVIYIFIEIALLLFTGKIITHYNYKESISPSGEIKIVVMEDYSFNNVVISQVYAGENSKIKFFWFSFSKEGNLLTKVYHTNENQDSLEIKWVTEEMILINGKESHLSK